MLYQAVEKDQMTEVEADNFRTWFDQRPTEEAPELLNHLPPQIHRDGRRGFRVRQSGLQGYSNPPCPPAKPEQILEISIMRLLKP